MMPADPVAANTATREPAESESWLDKVSIFDLGDYVYRRWRCEIVTTECIQSFQRDVRELAAVRAEAAQLRQRLAAARSPFWRRFFGVATELELRTVLEDLTDVAASVTCEPRRFLKNEGNLQQELSRVVANARGVLRR